MECKRIETNLPIYAYQSRIINQVWNNQVSIVIGDTGSGKTTQICQYLYEGGIISTNTKLVCTQPRKIAAISTANRVADELGESVGGLVGYQTGMDSKWSPRNTKILFVTDHILLNQCLKDEDLRGYSCIIIDEAHERSIYTDLLIGFVKKILSRRRDLRVVITSATIDPDLFVQYFQPENCPVLKIPGRLFPVEVIYNDCEPNEAYYLSMATDKALELHCNSSIDSGSILVFLSTPSETEDACRTMSTRVEGLTTNKPCLCLPLHGKLDIEEQRRVFDEPPPGTRKIVFATNSGETSITIPNVGMVVDSGFVKEASYDSKRNLDILAVTLVTQSIADQRKGRAGRTRSGKCYRLYDYATYHEKMKPGTNPEILRVNLGLAFLKLYSLGVDPSKFDFVEAPEKSQIEETVKMLETLGAIRHNIITPLGEWISKLPLNPYFSVFIHEAIDKGVVLEAVVVSAIASLSGGSLFYHRNALKDADEKQKLDASYMRFSHEYGDVFTYLNVFREWLKQNNAAFCNRNSLNRKNLLLVKSTTKEILVILNREFREYVPFTFDYERSDSYKVIRSLLFKTFRHNLCHYLGRDSAGYLVIQSDERVHLFPSSSLKCLGALPEWIFFLSTMKTHRTFAVNAHPIDEVDVQQSVEEGLLDIDVEDIKRKKLEGIFDVTVGSKIFSQFVGPCFRKVKALEKDFQNDCERHEVVIIESMKENGSLMVFTSHEENKIDISGKLSQIVNDLVLNIRSETFDYDMGGKTRAVIEAGAKVDRILYSNEIVKLLVCGPPRIVCNTSSNHVMSLFSEFGTIKSCYRYENGPKSQWGSIVFEEPETVDYVLDAFKNSDKRSELYVKTEEAKITSKTARHLEYEFTMDFSFGHSQFKKIAFVTFSDIHCVMQALDQHFIYGKNKHEKFQVFKLQDPEQQSLAVIVAGISTNIHYQLLSKIICRSLALPANNIVKIEFQDFPSEFVTSLQTRSVNYCNQMMERGRKYLLNFEQNRRNPSVNIFGRFECIIKGFEAFKHFKKSLRENYGLDCSVPMFSWSVHISHQHYAVVSHDLNEILSEFQSICDGSYDVQLLYNGNLIVIKASNMYITSQFLETKSKIETLIYIDEMNCANLEHLHLLFEKKGRILLNKIESRTQTMIVTDSNTVHLKVYGSESNRIEAFKEINQFQEEMARQKIQHIDLKAPSMPKGLAKRLLMKFGLELEELINKAKLSNCEIDLCNHSLLMMGNDDSFGKAMKIIEEEINFINNNSSSSHPSATSHDDDSLLQECCACLCPIDSSISYRIESCGHPYCLFCIVEYLKVSQKSKSFPLICSKEDCNQPYSISDLKAFEKMGFISLKEMFQSSVETFVQANITKYFSCCRPECTYVFKITKFSKRVQCPLCLLNHCSACKVAPYHDNMTCKQNSSNEKLPNRLQKWFDANPQSRKRCPNCFIGIEKTEGCHHVICAICKKHICWVCLLFFDKERECYGHMRRAHLSFV